MKFGVYLDTFSSLGCKSQQWSKIWGPKCTLVFSKYRFPVCKTLNPCSPRTPQHRIPCSSSPVSKEIYYERRRKGVPFPSLLPVYMSAYSSTLELFHSIFYFFLPDCAYIYVYWMTLTNLLYGNLLRVGSSPISVKRGNIFQLVAYMFTNSQRQEERTGKYGTPRVQYLQELVNQFQSASSEESKERIVANLANFAYDPYNYTFLRQLNVLELFLDCTTEPNEKLVEFGVGGICNACVDPANAAVVTRCSGIPLIIECLSSPVRNTVNYAIGALYYICDTSNKAEILKPEVVDVIKRYAAAAGAVSVSFSNLAQAFLDKHVP